MNYQASYHRLQLELNPTKGVTEAKELQYPTLVNYWLRTAVDRYEFPTAEDLSHKKHSRPWPLEKAMRERVAGAGSWLAGQCTWKW